MKSNHLLLLFIIFSSVSAGAQILICGNIPDTHCSVQLTDSIGTVGDFTSENLELDVDGDGMSDFLFKLEWNAVFMDLANRLFIQGVDSTARVCSGLTHPMSSRRYSPVYEQGDSLLCFPDLSMDPDSEIIVGDYGTWITAVDLPFEADSGYLHFELNQGGITTQGWIKLSFHVKDNVDPSLPIWMKLHEVVYQCIVDDIEEIEELPLELIPLGDGRFRWQSEFPIDQIRVHDITGRLVLTRQRPADSILDLNNLSKAILTITFTSGQGQKTFKISTY